MSTRQRDRLAARSILPAAVFGATSKCRFSDWFAGTGEGQPVGKCGRSQSSWPVSEFKMDHATHQAHGHVDDPHAGHKIAETHVSHDRHAGHSVAMFRDKFWLSLALTIPVVFWSSDVQHWL